MSLARIMRGWKVQESRLGQSSGRPAFPHLLLLWYWTECNSHTRKRAPKNFFVACKAFKTYSVQKQIQKASICRYTRTIIILALRMQRSSFVRRLKRWGHDALTGSTRDATPHSEKSNERKSKIPKQGHGRMEPVTTAWRLRPQPFRMGFRPPSHAIL